MQLDRAALEAVFEALLRAHGPQGWWPGESPFEIIAGAILIQRTAWRNAVRALDNLRRAGRLAPGPLARMNEEELHTLVRPAGFYRQKSARLIAASRWLERLGGIAGAAALEDAELRGALRALPGIGEETADAICLYAFERPTFVVDAYARRLLARLGLIGGRERYAALRAALQRALDRDAAYYNEYHALIVAHGKARCRVRPDCAGCVLLERCRHGRAARGGVR